MERSRRTILAGVLGLLLSGVCAQVVTADPEVIVEADGEENSAVLPEGMKIENLNVGGKTIAQARQIVHEYLDSLADQPIRFTSAAGMRVDSTFAELGVHWTNEAELMDGIMGDFDMGNLICQYKNYKDIESGEEPLQIELAVSDDAMARFMVGNMKAFETSPQNASVARGGDGSWQVIPSVNGFTPDYDTTVESLTYSLKNFEPDQEITVEVAGNMATPQYSTEVFDHFGALLGEFSTEYDRNAAQRSVNVELATSKFNGRVYMPGETISALAVMSPVTEAGGYQKAPAYENGEITWEISGGVCQVSTTLYNAALRAELQIVFRHQHSMAVNYVLPSFDAMVAPKDNSDFKVANNTGHAIYIETQISDATPDGMTGRITFRIFGTEYRPENRRVEFESVVKEYKLPDPPFTIKKDNNLAVYDLEEDWLYVEGKTTMDGVTTARLDELGPHLGINSYLVKRVYEGGALVSESILHYDNYTPKSGIIYLNENSIVEDVYVTDEGKLYLVMSVRETEPETTEEETDEDESGDETKDDEKEESSEKKEEPEKPTEKNQPKEETTPEETEPAPPETEPEQPTEQPTEQPAEPEQPAEQPTEG